MGVATAISVVFMLIGAISSTQVLDDWSKTAEGSFLTPEERRIWKSLDTPAAREEFQRGFRVSGCNRAQQHRVAVIPESMISRAGIT